MRKKISHAKEHIARYARSLKAKYGHGAGEKRVSDIGRDLSLPKTITLREKVWRIELSRRKVRRFFLDHKISTAITFGVLAALVFARYALIGFASTADFYPSSCLGSWDNVQNALGKPDVDPSASAAGFTTFNSAVFSTGTAQMFCGNFSGGADIATLAAKPFEKADLVLSWTAVFPDSGTASSSAATTSLQEVGGGAQISVLSDVSSSTPTADVTSTQTSTPDIVAPTSTPALEVTPGSSSTTAPATSTSTQLFPVPSDTLPADASSTSWITKWLNVAYAQDVIFSTTSTATSTASTTEGVPTLPQPTPITVNTSMFQNIVMPSSTPGDFLGIVYSTDGVTWQPLVDINKDNWQAGRYTIPISSWDELKHLQVAFVGLGDPNSPRIYLDAATVEVSYVDTPEGTTNITPNPDQAPDSAVSSTDQTIPPDPGAILQQPTISESDVFEQGARQQCVVAPFSQTISPGTPVQFSLQLFSGLTTPSSTVKPGAASSSLPQGYQHATYQARLGSLPVGVSAYLVDGAMSDASSTKTIKMQVGYGASRGSYSLLVIYRERQDDASLRSTACQFNLVIQ